MKYHYTLLSAMFNLLHSGTNQELLENHLHKQSSPLWKIQEVQHAPVIIWMWSIHYASLTAMLNLLQIKTYSKRTSVIKVLPCSQYKINRRMIFVIQRKPSHTTTKLTLFAVSKYGTPRRTLVSPWRMYCMYCSMPKGTFQDKATSNSEKSSL